MDTLNKITAEGASARPCSKNISTQSPTRRLCLTLMAALMAMFVFCTTSCRELSLDGDLAGQWKVTEIKFPDGSVMTPPETDAHYCIYRHTAMLTSVSKGSIKANIDYDYPTLVMGFARGVGYAPRYFGLLTPEGYVTDNRTPLTVTFNITSLSSGHLEMTSDQGVTIIARKF